MNILPYQLSTTNDFLTSRAGLLCLGQLIENIGFSELVDNYFPSPQSNRGFKPSVFVDSIMLMLHDGGRRLDDLRHIREDETLRMMLGLEQVPESDTLGDWLRRMGKQGVEATQEVNRKLLEYSLADCQSVTLDIDATLLVSQNENAKWTYKKCTGYMPMVGHIAQTGQVLATDFRDGNVSPNTRNLEFIHQCEAALPEGVGLSAIRIDSAGYQTAILDECIDRELKFAIRAKMSGTLKQLILAQEEEKWVPLINKGGDLVKGEQTTRLVHTMEKSQHGFDVIVQRRLLSGQQMLDVDTDEGRELVQCGQYLYRAIAIGGDETLENAAWVHWYNERGEHSENRIKELKEDFAGDRMPCRDFDANALFFSLCALAFNLFALMRMHLPDEFANSQAKTVRWRLYAIAGKVVRHGRRLYLKLREKHRALLSQALISIQKIAQAP